MRLQFFAAELDFENYETSIRTVIVVLVFIDTKTAMYRSLSEVMPLDMVTIFMFDFSQALFYVQMKKIILQIKPVLGVKPSKLRSINNYNDDFHEDPPMLSIYSTIVVQLSIKNTTKGNGSMKAACSMLHCSFNNSRQTSVFL